MKKSPVIPCATWAKELAAAHPDDLSPSERAALEAHIESCPACAAVRSSYREIDARIRALPPIEPLFTHAVQLPPRKREHNRHRATNNERRALAPARRERKATIMSSPTSTEANSSLPVESPDSDPVSRSTRLMRAMSAIAAVLVVSAIVGGFLVLLTHRSPGSGGTAPNLAPASPPAVYVGLDANNGTAYALRPNDGSIIWQHRVDQGGQKFSQ